MTTILLTTMGTTWQIPPELIGFTNPGLVDMYRFHPYREHFQYVRKDNEIPPVDELWIVTTTGRVDQHVQKVFDWHSHFSDALNLYVWQVADTDELGTEEECRRMKEAILRLVLHASERSRNGRLLLSLAGGRKTMSSDMQFAASVFGCHALLHVIDHHEYSRQLNRFSPSDFTVPIPEASARAATPLVTDRYIRNSLVDMAFDTQPAISAADYPVSWPPSGQHDSLSFSDFPLTDAIQNRLKRAENLTINYTHQLMSIDEGTNFLALYHLPPHIINELKTTVVGVDPAKKDDELNWLRQLPKAELHCHLGGVLDASDMIRVATANQKQIEPHIPKLKPWLDHWNDRVHKHPPMENRKKINFKDIPGLFPDVPQPLAVSAFILLFQDNPDRLDEMIFGALRQEENYCRTEFNAYEKLGDLQGSRLLQNTESIRETCRILTEKAAAQHITHMEVRCSPVKYQKGNLTDVDVMNVIADEIGKTYPDLSIILTASRHNDKADILHLTRLAQQLLDRPEGFPRLKGFDLAGNESACRPQEVRENLLPLMEKCLHITIHAGEDVDVQSIWGAVYHLNAERIGHGLTLKQDPELLKRFIDKNIAVEMCPSSNFQIVGFRDNYLPGTWHRDIYPLKEYLDQGVKVTVNTDNPGISRTDLTHELHRAARMTPNGLSLWDILKIVRNGFKASFVDRVHRNRMLRDAEKKIVHLIQQSIPK